MRPALPYDDRADVEVAAANGVEEPIAHFVAALAEFEFASRKPARVAVVNRALRRRGRRVVGEDDHCGDEDGARAAGDVQAGVPNSSIKTSMGLHGAAPGRIQMPRPRGRSNAQRVVFTADGK